MIKQINSKEDITHSMSPVRRDKSMELYDEMHGVMNEIHGTDFSKRFWMILLGDIVMSAMSRIHVLKEKDIKRKPDLYPVNSYNLPTRKEKVKAGLFLLAKHLKTRGNRDKIDALLKNENEFRIGFPEFDGMDNEGIGVELPLYYPFITGRGDRDKRKKVNEISERYPDPFMRNVVRELPAVVVEHFGKLYNSIELYRAERKKFHIHIPYTWCTLYLIAKYSENGSRLVWYQHGSYYGEFEGDGAHHYEHEISDEYRTWGWKIKNKDTPWKAYRLEKFQKEYGKHPNTNTCDLLVAFSKINSGNRKESNDLMKHLLEHLDPDKFKKILVRPQPANKVFSQKSQLDFIESDRVIKSNGLTHMAGDMSKCRLVLQMRVPATNFLECLYVGHPTVGILRNDQPTDIVKPYYDYFVEHGVLHLDLDSLVTHLNRIDVEKWWARLYRERAFKEYRYFFARNAVEFKNKLI